MRGKIRNHAVQGRAHKVRHLAQRQTRHASPNPKLNIARVRARWGPRKWGGARKASAEKTPELMLAGATRGSEVKRKPITRGQTSPTSQVVRQSRQLSQSQSQTKRWLLKPSRWPAASLVVQNELLKVLIPPKSTRSSSLPPGVSTKTPPTCHSPTTSSPAISRHR